MLQKLFFFVFLYSKNYTFYVFFRIIFGRTCYGTTVDVLPSNHVEKWHIWLWAKAFNHLIREEPLHQRFQAVCSQIWWYFDLVSVIQFYLSYFIVFPTLLTLVLFVDIVGSLLWSLTFFLAWVDKGHFTHKTKSPWPLHSKHSHREVVVKNTQSSFKPMLRLPSHLQQLFLTSQLFMGGFSCLFCIDFVSFCNINSVIIVQVFQYMLVAPSSCLWGIWP